MCDASEKPSQDSIQISVHKNLVLSFLQAQIPCLRGTHAESAIQILSSNKVTTPGVLEKETWKYYHSVEQISMLL